MAAYKKVVTHVAPVAITATNTPAAGVDTQGFDAATAIIGVGVVANIANSPQPSWAFHAEESDSSGSGFTAITDSAQIAIAASASPVAAPDSSTGVFLTIDAAAEDATNYHVGIVSSKRYLRIVATAANTPGSTPYSVVMVLEAASSTPVSN